MIQESHLYHRWMLDVIVLLHAQKTSLPFALSKNKETLSNLSDIADIPIPSL
jgi:hypothetical protein